MRAFVVTALAASGAAAAPMVQRQHLALSGDLSLTYLCVDHTTQQRTIQLTIQRTILDTILPAAITQCG